MPKHPEDITDLNLKQLQVAFMDFSSVIKNYSGVVIFFSRQRCLGFASNAKFSCTEGIDEGVSSTTSRKSTIQFEKWNIRNF